MSKKIAVIDNDNKVVDCVFAESIEGISFLFEGRTLLEVPEGQKPIIGGLLLNGRLFVEPKPHESWVYSEEKLAWVAPIEEPEIEEDQLTVWNESEGKWDIFSWDSKTESWK